MVSKLKDKLKQPIMLGGIIAAMLILAVGMTPKSMFVSAESIDSYELVSVNDSGDGQGGDNHSSGTVVTSANGRYVAFESRATNLVSNDTNGEQDVFVRDLKLDTTTRVSVSTSGTESNAESGLTNISETGRYVIYKTAATNLEAGSTPYIEAYMYDLQTDTNHYVGETVPGNRTSHSPIVVSNDGRIIAGVHTFPDLFDDNGVFVSHQRVALYDAETGEWERLALPVSGGEQQSAQDSVKMSCDGSFIVFRSNNANLVQQDDNGTTSDVFLADLRNENRLINLTHTFNGDSLEPRISCNGNYVTFKSTATDIVSNPSVSSGQHYYRYNRITGSFSLVDQQTNGNLLYSANLRHMSDDGTAILTAKTSSSGFANHYWFLRDEEGQTTEYIEDASGQSIEAVGFGSPSFDANGDIFSFRSTRIDFIPSDTNGYNDIFVAEIKN